MKNKYYLITLLLCCTFAADAQNILGGIGRAIKNKVENDMANRTMTVPDKGKNVAREEGCDYIDEYGINHGGGISIDGVVWAPVNCGYHEKLFPYGKLYQWGRKLGQGYSKPFLMPKYRIGADSTEVETYPAPVDPVEALKPEFQNRFIGGEDFHAWNWCKNDMRLWNISKVAGQTVKNPVHDPCPEGWRVASKDELAGLLAHQSGFTIFKGQAGLWFSGSKQYSPLTQRIFLPAAGERGEDSKSFGRGNLGSYWSATHTGTEGAVYVLYYTKNDNTRIDESAPREGCSVRCVREK